MPQHLCHITYTTCIIQLVNRNFNAMNTYTCICVNKIELSFIKPQVITGLLYVNYVFFLKGRCINILGRSLCKEYPK